MNSEMKFIDRTKHLPKVLNPVLLKVESGGPLSISFFLSFFTLLECLESPLILGIIKND